MLAPSRLEGVPEEPFLVRWTEIKSWWLFVEVLIVSTWFLLLLLLLLLP